MSLVVDFKEFGSPVQVLFGLANSAGLAGWQCDPADTALLLDKAITGCTNDDVAEIQSLGRTLTVWPAEILAHHTTGASNNVRNGRSIPRCGESGLGE